MGQPELNYGKRQAGNQLASFEALQPVGGFGEGLFFFAKGKSSQPGALSRIVIESAGGNGRDTNLAGEAAAKRHVIGKTEM